MIFREYISGKADEVMPTLYRLVDDSAVNTPEGGRDIMYGYRRLWAAVLLQALDELSGDINRLRIEARNFFYGDSSLDLCCLVIGIDKALVIKEARKRMDDTW